MSQNGVDDESLLTSFQAPRSPLSANSGMEIIIPNKKSN